MTVLSKDKGCLSVNHRFLRGSTQNDLLEQACKLDMRNLHEMFNHKWYPAYTMKSNLLFHPVPLELNNTIMSSFVSEHQLCFQCCILIYV